MTERAGEIDAKMVERKCGRKPKNGPESEGAGRTGVLCGMCAGRTGVLCGMRAGRTTRTS